MKILITGKNSYIGNNLRDWIRKNDNRCEVVCISLRQNKVSEIDFSGYDTIVHVAGIAHVDDGNLNDEMSDRYYKINTHLTEECAKKAKEQGVRQFIYLSSIIVYGESGRFSDNVVIDCDTRENPVNAYGDSKLRADNLLKKMQTDSFNVAIIRCPMVYGKESKGNFSLLSKLASVAFVFPKFENARSMIYVKNLCEFIRLIIINKDSGVFYPQNEEYVCTFRMVGLIRNAMGKKCFYISLFNPVIRLLGSTKGKCGRMCYKAFGSMVYDKDISKYKQNYNIYSLEESIRDIFA